MKAKGIVAVLLLGILVVSSAACGGGSPGLPPTPASGTTATPSPPPVEASATPSQAVYLPGEAVTIEFSFENVSAEPAMLWPFSPEMEITRPRGSEVLRSFEAGPEQITLGPGETTTYTFVWDQKDASGQPVGPGYYWINGYYYVASEGGYDQSWDYYDGFESRHGQCSSWAEVVIQYPQGAMEKSVQVNQSQTASDLTITITRVELSATGVEVYGFTTPPNFDPSQGTPFPPPPQMMIAGAEHSVDGGPEKWTGYGGSQPLEDGLELSWLHLDPIPSDAEVLVFTITEVELRFAPGGTSEWSGPWEFEIPLQ